VPEVNPLNSLEYSPMPFPSCVCLSDKVGPLFVFQQVPRAITEELSIDMILLLTVAPLALMLEIFVVDTLGFWLTGAVVKLI